MPTVLRPSTPFGKTVNFCELFGIIDFYWKPKPQTINQTEHWIIYWCL